MRVIRKRRGLALFLAIAAVVALTAAGAAYALTAFSFKYASPKTSYVRISHMAFTANAHFVEWSQSHTTGLTSATGGCFNAGVNLPVRSKVKSVTWYYQSAATEDFEGSFRRNQLATGVGSPIIGPVTPADDSDLPTSVTRRVPAAEQLVGTGRAYWVEACPGSDGHFFGARIKYTYTSAGS
jgi:hypothetical protein